MQSEPSLNPGELMNTDNQIDSTLCIPESHDISFGNTLNPSKGSIGVKLTSSLLEGAIFIVSNGAYQHEKIPSDWQRPVDLLTQTFDGVAALNNYPKYFFHDLIKAYADLYNIDLHLIVYLNNKYIIIDKSNFPEPNDQPYNRERHAFIWCNVDNTACCPLYINDVNGRMLTVFKTDEVFAWQFVESFVNQINQELINTAQNQTEQHLNLPEDDLSHMAIDNTFSSTNHSPASVNFQRQSTLTVGAFIDQMLLQIGQLKNSLAPRFNEISLENVALADFNIANLDQLSPQASATLLQKRLMLISEAVQIAIEQISTNNDTTISSNIVVEDSNHQGNTVQLNQTNHSVQTDQNSVNVQSLTPTHLSNTTQVPQPSSIITPVQTPYRAPNIIIQPKPVWDYRNMKDLGKKGMPLLAGDGPQRTPIRVKVPRKGAHPMYLGIKIQTYDGRDHPSKIAVPKGTSVNMGSLCNNNDLNLLQFGQCNQIDYFDSENKYVYLAISLSEHETQEKDVQVHMFNLYQNGSITREMIETEQLDKCKLAFWLCFKKDEEYIPISQESFSSTITEKKKNKNNGPPLTVTFDENE